MKTLTLLIGLALAIPGLSTAQENGDRVIIVNTGLNSQDGYTALAKTMISRGFKVSKSDDTFHTLLFEPYIYEFEHRRVTTWRYLIVSATASEGEVYITAQHKPSGTRKRDTIYNEKRKEIVEAFNILTDIAGELGEVSFKK